MARGGETDVRPGRAPSPSRERILAAARSEFAAKGYRGATMRSIAAAAGVDVALPPHYFGNKDSLFAACLELPPGAPDLLGEALSAPAAQQGERLTRVYLGLWEDPATAAQMQVLGRSVLSSELAGDRLRALLTGATADSQLAALLEGRQHGFALAMGHLVGLAVTRYLIRLPAVAQLPFEEVVARVAPAVQLHLDARDAPS